MAFDSFTLVNERWEIDKDPDAVLTYRLDLTDVLNDAGQTLASATVTVSGVAKVEDHISGSVVFVTLSGGDVGSYGKAKFHYTFGAQQDDITLWFRIVEK